MSKLIDFKEKLLGLYHNRNQAFSYPQLWAHIYVEFNEMDNGNIFSKSWYSTENKKNPYKKTILEVEENDNSIIVIPSNPDTRVQYCNIIFDYIDGYWVGENLKCIIPEKNMYVSTSLKFDGNNYFSRDAGYDLSTDKFLWGKDKKEGYFHFIKEK